MMIIIIIIIRSSENKNRYAPLGAQMSPFYSYPTMEDKKKVHIETKAELGLVSGTHPQPSHNFSNQQPTQWRRIHRGKLEDRAFPRDQVPAWQYSKTIAESHRPWLSCSWNRVTTRFLP